MIKYGLASWYEYVYIVCIDLVLKSLPHLFCKRGLARETVFTCSLAGQPLLTQKARKGLVNNVALACLNGMHIAPSNVTSLTKTTRIALARFVSNTRLI